MCYLRVWINIHALSIKILTFYSNLLTVATFAKEFAFVSLVIRRESFLQFFFDTRTAWRAGVYDRPVRRDQAESVLSLGVGGRFPINRLLPALSEQHEPAGKIELSYRFPFARSRMWKTCVSPVGDASLLIDGDASKTFKIARRSRRKESERGIMGGRPDPSTPRRTIARRLHIWERSLRQKERVSLSSASGHTSRQGHHETAEGFLIFVRSLARGRPSTLRMADGQQPGAPISPNPRHSVYWFVCVPERSGNLRRPSTKGFYFRYSTALARMKTQRNKNTNAVSKSASYLVNV